MNTSDSPLRNLRFDWRWLVVGYGCLILLQLFPSYFLFGLRRAPQGNFSGVYLLWMALGASIVAGFIGSRSKGSPILESLLVSLLYLLTVVLIHRGGFKSFLPHTAGKVKILLFTLFLVVCLAGVVIGKITRLRREKKTGSLAG